MALLFLVAVSAVMAQGKIYYVSPTGNGTADGSSWTNTMTLTDALTAAKAGEQIWVQGFEQIDATNKLYITPTTDGFTLKSGVQLYGGFAGTETSINDRETLGKPYQLKYRTVLSGDIDMNDAVDNTNLIFPANTKRTDNATHVLSINMAPSSGGNNNTYPTVVNGFSIGGGQADGTDEKGGGIYIHGDNTNGGIFRIERCFFVNNYATQGGAIYVGAEVQNRNNNESLINQCVIYNNAAGERAAVVNAGGGIYLAGQATVVNSSIFNNENGGLRLSTGSKVINSTVARNSGAGIDMIETVTDFSVFNVSNTIIWGNTLLSAENQPNFQNSAYHEVTVTNTDAGTDGNHNVYVTKENRGDKDAPMFDAPSVKTSFDRDFNWRQMAYPLWSWNVLEGSVMHDKGNDGAYQTTTYGDQDMGGNPRVDGTIDIGAYEFQKIPTSRIRYVKPGGTGDGSSWNNASGDLQKMIDELADNNPQNLAGEVWVAAGTYAPQSQLISGTAYSASFRMRDGISVYGGFAGTETTKQERKKGTMPWDYTNVTILEGAYYDHANLQWNNNKWTLTSDSRHVVWFAPMANEGAFGRVTILDGVTIQGGYAQGGTGLDDFMTDRGAGVYMDGANAYLTNCVVKENYATGNGGGVYLKDGRVQTSLIYNNNADADGGAVYVDNTGLVHRSMLANNSAYNGAGAYLHNEIESGTDHPEYLILTTCVISNNTTRGNGAVYCSKGGVLMQNTITNNNCVTATDATDSKASQTGGIYIDEYALVLNSVIWNNRKGTINIPMYVRNPSASTVRFLYNAISGTNNAVWNYTLQEQTLSLVDDNAGATDDGGSIGPRFTEPTTDMDFKLATDYGVQEDWKDGIISYYWEPVSGSNLWARGMALGMLPAEVVLAPELDIQGKTFAQKPAVGAFMVEATEIVPKETDDAFIVYVDVECTEPGHQGDSWATAYRSLNNAIDYLANLDEATVGDKRLEVHVLEGDLWPRYAFVNNDPKTATVTVPATLSRKAIEIYGGYHRDETDPTTTTVVRDPLTYRSIINGNTEAKDIKEGLYHCITVQQGAKLVLDGFHVINGYAAGEASLQYGAGLLAQANSEVTVRNCIFENNTAQDGAAIDAREATLTLQNCVVNNNTNTNADTGKPVVNAQTLEMEHVTIVNNVGAAPENTNNLYASSFSAGNSSNNTQTMTVDATQFTNPTKDPGATLGFDTYLGGYSSFQPTNQNPVVNAGTDVSGITQDITLGARDLGGAPDLGAYEADLPVSGTVIYVRTTTGSDYNDGLSWNKAKKTITAALNATTTSSAKEIWVAAGTYTEHVTMQSGINVYGGFAATGNPKNELDGINRDISNSLEGFKTTIDGSNGGRVLTQSNNYSTVTTWEGFIIQNGYMSGNYVSSNGAGVYLRRGGKLKNCLIQNNTYTMTTNNSNKELGGGGLYVAGGTVDGCIIRNNSATANGLQNLAGAGIFMNGGTLINSIIVENSAKNYNNNILGAGLFLKSQSYLYNCTIAYNWGTSGGSSPVAGGVWDDINDNTFLTNSYFYNCILWGNYGIGSSGESTFQVAKPGYSTGGGFNPNVVNCYVSATRSAHVGSTNWNDPNLCAKFSDYDSTNGTNFYNACKSDAPFDNTTYQLKTTGKGLFCINKGNNNHVEEQNIYLDAAGVSRIQYCTVDKGAYESTNAITFEPDNNGVYYVTQNGAGTSNASSEANAACATELQRVLHAAGERAKTGQVAIVKVAGYDQNVNPFVYHANTLSDQNDPQSYTYVIPYGVTVMGGYSDQDPDWDNDGDGYKREPMTYVTKLSAINNSAELEQDVNGFHVVTFGEKPDGWTGEEKSTIIDGLWLEDGSATSMAGTGNPNTRGGGAIVPAWAHVRNCVVTNCKAIEGGGLYLLPGATVSGTAIIECEATNGAGIYADNTGADADTRAHILSCTIANNEASSTGGGLYMEEGAVMNVNTVVFGNRAGSDKNVSGVVSQQFDDNKLAKVFDITDQTSFYPFNNCFVETQEMPSDFENRMLESDKSLYFIKDDDHYRLKDYSLLIKHGLKNQYQNALVTTFNVATQDMQNISRIQTGEDADRLDAGAFAYNGNILPTDLFTRIFVSPTTNVTLPDGEDMGKYLGRSFYTSFSTLEDALGYIRSMRAKGHNDQFEILVAGGTYKPSSLRATTADVTHDQRLYSFEVPQGVSIYGGFAGTENYSSGDITSIPTTGGDVSVDNTTLLTTILEKRAYSDFNQNNILEPWELANQTILSGQINASSTAQNAYHVVFTDKGEATTVNPVVLDGLTVMYGQTDDELSYSTKEDEQGRGGGIYSNGVTYTISRCRLLNNTAVRGGAVFVRNADLNLSGCILSGNKTVANTATGQTTTLTSRGGAAYVSGIDKEVNLRAVNTLWANNESAEEGGAIGTNFADGLATYHDPLLYIMNNTFVRNKATTNPVIYARNGKSHIVNTLIWGNQGKTYQDLTDLSNIYDVSHCASDVDYVEKFTSGNSYNNILLSTENMGDKGPRFTNPSTEAGADGNSASTLWNPVAISVLTDAGDGTEHNDDSENTDESDHSSGATTGTYKNWFDTNGYLGQNGVKEAYITGPYSRYSGPRGQNNEELCKPIDIGLYEYQYFSNFSKMSAIYVDTRSQGTGSGNSWANATDDLRGAIVGAANPTDRFTESRVVYVRDGNYSWNKTSAGSAYILNMLDDENNISLTLKGSCTGSGDQQDFSKQTILRNDGATTNLMSVSTNSKPVTIEGFTFINDTENTGIGINASTGSNGSLTIKNSGFRISNTGLNIAANSGKVLIYNTLFADGGTGLRVGSGTTTVVNATFANNKTADMTGTANVYNSVSWNNTDQYLPTGNNNVSIAGTVANDNVNKGPNFVDPLNDTKEKRDYRIRPSVQLLNKGNNNLYLNHVVKVVADANATAIPATEVDLGNNARLVDDDIDIGAYEYEAPLQPIVYVKADLTGTADGKSWETALGDLQGAVDLAGLYAYNNEGKNGYVFVHGNYNDTGSLNLTLGNTKVYGGMNDERSDVALAEDFGNVNAVVNSLLSKRKGMLESANRSSLGTVTMSANGVIDGFVLTGTATVKAGALSTSVVKNDVGGVTAGLLYNSLVLGNGTTEHPGNVSGVTTVNVTATGTITEAANGGNNRAPEKEDETNSYVTEDYWKYQLMETSADIDPNPDDDPRTDISEYMKKVGHERDLIGNKRIRNIVDNGCFETWNISKGMTTDSDNDGNVDAYPITATDYPVGKSVVYVRKGQELKIQNDGTLVYPNGNAFNPGFLLLEHQAGLRGNGNFISLANFAVERDIPAGGADLVAMPFDVNSTTSVLAGVKPKRYDGSVRAAYDYKFDDGQSTGNQTAWTDQNMDQAGMYEGLLFENTTEQDQTLRFYGKSTAPYTENGMDKSISLQKYNFNDPWTSETAGGNRFTHKENMGWNLFGSPYLCAMNYSDLEYGRVLYGYNNGSYQPVNTVAENGTTVEGHIPAGSAVFTQTATLKDAEIFAVAQPVDKKSGTAFSRFAPVQVVIESLSTTKSTDQTLRDDIGLSTVTPEFASTQFDLGSDGVKWMAGDETIPQIYMQRDGGRYSLLSAVNVEGSVEVGVRVGEPGDYLLYLPEKLDLSDYSSILLTDRHAGKMVDLKQGSYAFTATRATDMEGRFSLSFNRSIEAVDLEVKFYSPTPGVVIVEGLPEHARVNWYTTMGRLVEIREAANWKETFYLRSDIYMMEVYDMEGKERIGSYKVRVR